MRFLLPLGGVSSLSILARAHKSRTFIVHPFCRNFAFGVRISRTWSNSNFGRFATAVIAAWRHARPVIWIPVRIRKLRMMTTPTGDDARPPNRKWRGLTGIEAAI